MDVKGEVKSATFEAVVIRADGTREDLGVVARYDAPKPSLFRRIARRFRR